MSLSVLSASGTVGGEQVVRASWEPNRGNTFIKIRPYRRRNKQISTNGLT